MGRLCARVWTIAGLLAVAAPAWGQGGAAAEGAERGRREYNLGHWQRAIEEFEKAYQTSGDATLLFNLGLAHRQLGGTADALRMFKTYLREKPDAPNRGVAEQQIRELEGRPAPPATPPAPRPSPSPAPAPVAGVAPAPAPATPPGPTGSPNLAPTFATPSPATSAPSATVTATPAPSSREPPLPRWLPWVGAGTTVALITGAIVSGVSASNEFDSLQNSCGQTTAGCTAEQIDSVRTRDKLATILWIAAGATGAATGVFFVVNASSAGISGLWRF
jgi:hypothetical protein